MVLQSEQSTRSRLPAPHHLWTSALSTGTLARTIVRRGEIRMAKLETARRRPLEGIRVIDVTKIVAGPNATRMLATMGAEVIRVEWHDQRALDMLRMVRPHAPGGDRESVNRSGLFNNINAGKYGVTLNMNLPQGRDLFKRLVAQSAVLCENYSPAQMERWVLGYPTL